MCQPFCHASVQLGLHIYHHLHSAGQIQHSTRPRPRSHSRCMHTTVLVISVITARTMITITGTGRE